MERRFSEDYTNSGVHRMPKQTTPTMPHHCPSNPSSSPLFTPGDATLAAMREKVIGSSSCSKTVTHSKQHPAMPLSSGARLIFGKGSSHTAHGGQVGVSHTSSSSSGLDNSSSGSGSKCTHMAPQTGGNADSAAAITDASIFNNLCEGIET